MTSLNGCKKNQSSFSESLGRNENQNELPPEGESTLPYLLPFQRINIFHWNKIWI